ncbi:endospore germination permease [Tissierella pigra]|uniref:GerAB/ArcD/ProY family transporter n=1 Tax=Tissierella pigra TaxID=2607614 RepID=UPI001C0F5A80|nr:endospore germination permease [Tissierella pigra]MBU5427879.1 endospore germination permease [Tissierella pigra]
MENKKISSSQYKSLMVIFIFGTSLIFVGNIHGEEDIWISILIAIAMSMPLALIYGKIAKLFPKMGLFDIFIKTYGKVLGKFFILAYSFHFFHLATMILRSMTEYIQVASLPDTSQYTTGILIGILIIYTINAGLSAFSTWAKLILPIVILLIITTIILGFNQFDYSYLMPILYNGLKPVMVNSYLFITFPFAETIVFLVFSAYADDNNDFTKVYIHSILIGGFFLLINVFRNILLLGFPNVNNVLFRSDFATSIITISNFIQRIEIIVSSNLTLTSFAKATTYLYAASLGFIKLFNIKKHKRFLIILCIIMVILSRFIFKSTMDMARFISFYQYYVIPFQFIIPLLTLTIGVIKKRNLKNNSDF